MAGIGGWSAKALISGYVGLMAALALAFYAFPSVHVLIWALIGLASAAAVLVGVRRNRPRRRAPWLWMAAGILTFSAGDTVYNVISAVSGDPNPFPSWADFLYI